MTLSTSNTQKTRLSEKQNRLNFWIKRLARSINKEQMQAMHEVDRGQLDKTPLKLPWNSKNPERKQEMILTFYKTNLVCSFRMKPITPNLSKNSQRRPRPMWGFPQLSGFVTVEKTNKKVKVLMGKIYDLKRK